MQWVSSNSTGCNREYLNDNNLKIELMHDDVHHNSRTSTADRPDPRKMIMKV